MLSPDKTSPQKGQAGIVIIFFVAAVAGIMSLSFLYRMRVELEASHNYLNALIAEQLALAGIERAIAELRNDNNHYDDLYENWAKGFREDFAYGFYDVQLISDEGKVKDVGIVDEASRLNINVAGWGFCNEGVSSFELNLGAIEGLDEKKAKAIVEYRWGDDKMPGKKSVDDDRDALFISKDGVDNDADGKVDEPGEGIDEPDEFSPDAPCGDDVPFETVEKIRLVPGIGDITYDKIKDRITVYSYDKNIDREGNLRVNINHASVSEIARAMKKAGFSSEEAAQIAVNIVDFRDEDNNPTEYRGKYGIERTPYINEVMPNFTTSAVVAAADLIKGGVKYLKEKAKEEVKKKIEEKTKGKVPYLDEILEKVTSTGEEKLEKEVDKFLEKYLKTSQKKEKIFSPFAFLKAKPAFAQGGEVFKVDIQIEWVELYNPYSSAIFLFGWKIKTSKGKKNLWGIVPARGWWVVINVVIKLPKEIVGKELLDNFSDEVELINKGGYTVDKVAYENYGVPWRAWEKNDPRTREFAGYIVGGSPWFRNWHWMPEVGGYTSEQAMADFYVKNKPFACVGEVGYIHTGKQWKTVSLDRQGDWAVLDRITTSFPPEEPVRGRININTATRDVLLSLPGIDEKLAEQLIKYCDGENGPFDEIGEICEVVGMQRLGINGLDDDGDGYVDEDDENEAIVRRISNLITVRSNCFTVICLGKVVKEGRVLAEKKVKVVVDRGSLPVRILYYRELYD